MSDGHWTVHACSHPCRGHLAAWHFSMYRYYCFWGTVIVQAHGQRRKGAGRMSERQEFPDNFPCVNSCVCFKFRNDPSEVGWVQRRLIYPMDKGYSMIMGYEMPLGIPHIPRRIYVDTGYMYGILPAWRTVRTAGTLQPSIPSDP